MMKSGQSTVKVASFFFAIFCIGCGEKSKDSLTTRLAAAEAAVRATPTAEAYVDLSLRYFEARNYNACITASYEAIRRKPESSIAYNNLAACYGAMSQWDAEIASAKQALRLSPDFQLAKNNLAWAESQRKTGVGVR